MPTDGYIQGLVPTADGGYMPVKIRMKRRGEENYPTAYPIGPAPIYGGENRSSELRAAEERARTAEERLRMAEERTNTRLAEERARTAEDRAIRAMEDRARSAEEHALRTDYANALRSNTAQNTGVNDVLSALLVAAVRGITGVNAPAYQQPAIQQPTQQPQPILITNQQPAQAPAQQQDGRHVVPPGAVMTTTSTTTIDASKRQNPATGYTGYEDDYDYSVYERLDDKNN